MIVISSFILFFISVVKVNAATKTMNWSDMPQDVEQVYIATRSSGNLTQCSGAVASQNAVNGYSVYNATCSSKYYSIGLLYNFIKDRNYKIDVYYQADGIINTSSKTLNDLTGLCTGDLGYCQNDTQHSNYTRLYFVGSSTNITVNSTYLQGNNTTTYTIYSKKVEVIFKANQNGSVASLYLNSNDTFNSLSIIGVKIEDLGTSMDVVQAMIDQQTNTEQTWVDNILESLGYVRTDIEGVVSEIESSRTIETNHYTWTISAITNAKNDIVSGVNNNTNNQITSQTNSITTTMNNNTQQTNNAIDNQNWECTEETTNLNDLPLGISKKYLNLSGQLLDSEDFDVTAYIRVKPLTQYTIQIALPYVGGVPYSYCEYNESYQNIGCHTYPSGVTIDTFTTLVSTKYMKFSFLRIRTNERLVGYHCVNTNQQNSSDIINNDGWTQQNANESTFNSLEQQEGLLSPYLIDDSDLSNLDYSVDATSNLVIWQIFTNVMTGNSIVYTAFLTILFLGIIKLILAR